MKRILAGLGVGPLLLLFGVTAIAAGQARTTVSIRLADTLSTGSTQPGDSFTGMLVTPLVVNDRVVADRGERVTGEVRQVVRSGGLSRPALITLRLRTAQTLSGRFPMQTGDLTVKADSHATRNLLIIGGSAGMGTLIGAAAGGRGAAIGAIAGAGAGAGGAYLTGKREIVLPAETLLTFHVTSVTVSPKEIQNLQRAGEEARSAPNSRDPYEEPYPVEVRRGRHHHDDDEDDDDDDEHEHGHGHRHARYHEHYGVETPRTIYVIFLDDHYADVDVYWPRRVERLRLRGDGLDDIYEPLARHTGFSVEVVRAKIKVKGGKGKFKHKDKD
jgi:hypothetical protein